MDGRMEGKEWREQLHADLTLIRDENRTAHAAICGELKALNGQVKSNKWSIRAIWTIFGGGWAVFLLWLKGQL